MNKPLFADCRKRQTICLSLCLLAILSGCTHTRLLKQGDGFADQGRLELAIQQYDRALRIKPDQVKTRAKRYEAEAGLRHWLAWINRAADSAYERNQKGRALLLYGKVIEANLGASPTTNARFRTLHSALSAESQLHVTTHYPADIFGNNLQAGIQDILPLEQSYTGLPNEREFTFEFQELGGKIIESDETRHGQYISGTQWVRNPALRQLKDQIYRLNHDVKELRHDRNKYRHRIDEGEMSLARLQREHNDDGDEGDEGSHKHHDTHDKKPDNEEIKLAKSQLHRVRRQLRKTTDQLQHHEHRLHQTINRLDDTPATILENIYSTHTYFVTNSTYTLKGAVVVTEGGHSRSYELEVASNDSYHEAQPLLDLAVDPLFQLSEQQLQIELRASARIFTQDYLRDELKAYRTGLLASANNTIGAKPQMEKLVSYGLSSHSGVNQQIARRMEQQLQSEYGIEGEFPINSLLHQF
jgi:hypothetical protein